MRALRNENPGKSGRSMLRRALARALSPSFRRVEEASFEEIEERLLMADFGVEAAMRCAEAVEGPLRKGETARQRLAREIETILGGERARPLARAAQPPAVHLVVGVNGAGKTTTVGKLAARLAADGGQSVIVAAADTYRAGAVAQLERWAGRAGAGFVRGQPGGDPAAVAFDAVAAARARGADVVLVDTAGRLHTQDGLMAELTKIDRVVRMQHQGAPHETLLVLDATAGQNSLVQARKFSESVEVTGVVLAKMDSTARGGIAVALKQELDLPVRFVGVGEELGDLEVFDPEDFVRGALATP